MIGISRTEVTDVSFFDHDLHIRDRITAVLLCQMAHNVRFDIFIRPPLARDQGRNDPTDDQKNGHNSGKNEHGFFLSVTDQVVYLLDQRR